MDREAWRAAIHGVAKSWTLQSDWTDWLTQRTMIFTDSQNEPGSQMTLELMNELIKTTLPADF